jgi:DNA-binding GntR family transcriptional regulator
MGYGVYPNLVKALETYAAFDAALANELSDPDLLMRHNREFHDIIYRSAHNRYLLKSLNALHDALVLLGKTTLSSRARADTSHSEHLAIVKAIIARDQALAEKLMRTHIRGAYHERLNMLFVK